MAVTERARASKEPEMVAVTLRLPVGVARRIAKAASASSMGPGEVVAELVERYLRPPLERP